MQTYKNIKPINYKYSNPNFKHTESNYYLKSIHFENIPKITHIRNINSARMNFKYKNPYITKIIILNSNDISTNKIENKKKTFEYTRNNYYLPLKKEKNKNILIYSSFKKY